MNIVVGIQRPKYMYFLKPVTDHCDDIDICDTDNSIFFNKNCRQGQKSIVGNRQTAK